MDEENTEEKQEGFSIVSAYEVEEFQFEGIVFGLVVEKNQGDCEQNEGRRCMC